VIGGHVLSSCEYYNANTETWNSLPVAMPDERAYCGAASVGDKVFVVGGERHATWRSDLISIDLSCGDLSKLSTKWETLAPMNQARSRFACVSDPQNPRYVYVFGGVCGTS
jgi:hypothetical protein